VDDTGPYNQAALTFMAGLTHKPESKQLKDGQRIAARVMGEMKKSPTEAQMLMDPELTAMMSGQVMRQVMLDTHGL
jgi:hypothetical protein